ncbi:hypothetical protein AWB85_19160 [Mycobacteroides immunogenum]|uniref:Polyketide cyclase n=1 Tax=Mycobacteroides immunogenum TaxID=83262 RepID=A0A179VD14_9MYCO|nr:hypothetical protein [Mycobacteroides immunogenum]OAT69779.1 hypothetical protein AWB85_19160 [Mycobacteroides immunogenum]
MVFTERYLPCSRANAWKALTDYSWFELEGKSGPFTKGSTFSSRHLPILGSRYIGQYDSEIISAAADNSYTSIITVHSRSRSPLYVHNSAKIIERDGGSLLQLGFAGYDMSTREDRLLMRIMCGIRNSGLDRIAAHFTVD